MLINSSSNMLRGKSCQHGLGAQQHRPAVKVGRRSTAVITRAELLADKPNPVQQQQQQQQETSSCPFLASLQSAPRVDIPWQIRLAQMLDGQLFQRTVLQGQTAGLVQVQGLLGILPPLHVPTNAALTKEIFAAENKGAMTQSGMGPIGAMLGEHSLVLVAGERHKYLRQLLQPAFNPEAIVQYVPSIQSLVEKHLGFWEAAGESGVKAHQAFQSMTMDFIAQVTTGREYSQEELSEISGLFSTWTKGFSWPWINLPFTNYGRAMAARENMLAHVQAAVTAARQQLAAGQAVPAVLGEMVAAQDEEGNRLTDAEICDNMLLLFFAGHDTSSTCLTQMMSNLQDHPGVMAKLRAEQQAVQAKHGDELSAAVLKDMVYAEAVIRETLRLNPVIAAPVPRIATKDQELAGFGVPAGTEFTLPLYYLAATDERWLGKTGDVDPAVFNPDRMLTPEGAKQGTQMPFGHGPRHCLGYGLAMAEMKAFLALLARHYTFTAENNTEWVRGVGMVPQNGLPLVVSRMA